MKLWQFEDGVYFYCPAKAEEVLKALDNGFGMYDGWKAKTVAEIVRQVREEEGVDGITCIELTVKHEGDTSHFWVELFGDSSIKIPLKFLDHPKIKRGIATHNEIWIEI